MQKIDGKGSMISENSEWMVTRGKLQRKLKGFRCFEKVLSDAVKCFQVDENSKFLIKGSERSWTFPRKKSLSVILKSKKKAVVFACLNQISHFTVIMDRSYRYSNGNKVLRVHSFAFLSVDCMTKPKLREIVR